VVPRRLLDLIALSAVLVLGCFQAGQPPPSGDVLPSTLVGTGWRVVAVNGRAPVPEREPTLAFEVDRVGGSGGCNHIGARYGYDASTGSFQVSDAGMTAMACAEAPVTAFEGVFMTALAGTTRAGLDPTGRLILLGPGTEIVLAPNPGAPT
jgi:heat shock protein HslJ